MLHSLAMNTDQGFSKDGVLVVLIFIPAMSQLSNAAAKSFSARWRPDLQWKKAKPDHPKKQTIDLAVSYRGIRIGLTALVYPVHINYEKQRRQNAPLPETNAHKKWL